MSGEWIEAERTNKPEDDESEIWEPEVIGETIIGQYIELEEEVGQFKSNLYHVRTKGGVKKIWGGTVLDDLMSDIPLKHEVKIKFDGKHPSKRQGGKPWKNWDVKHRPMEGEEETSSPSEPVHPAEIPKQDTTPEHNDALKFEANGYIRDCKSDNIEEAKDCLIDMLAKRMLVSEYSFSQEQIFKCALELLEMGPEQDD